MARLVEVLAQDQPEEEQSSCEAMLLFWYPQVGDQVAEGEDVAEIDALLVEREREAVYEKATITG